MAFDNVGGKFIVGCGNNLPPREPANREPYRPQPPENTPTDATERLAVSTALLTIGGGFVAGGMLGHEALDAISTAAMPVYWAVATLCTATKLLDMSAVESCPMQPARRAKTNLAAICFCSLIPGAQTLARRADRPHRKDYYNHGFFF